MSKQRFIVAEISKNFVDGEACDCGKPECGLMLAQRFENVIAVNLKRGYLLRDWKLDRVIVVHDGHLHLNESIIAVFAALEWARD